jgi:hypothetical protein
MRNANRSRAVRAFAGWAAFLLAAGAGMAVASTPSSTECTEGAEFIANAAQARENGMSREAFIDQMQSDFETIRAFPNELRWFVHDSADEAFLLGAAREVFDRPDAPELHRVTFFRACMSRSMV